MPIDIPVSAAADPITAGYKAVWSILKANGLFKSSIHRMNDWSDGKLQSPLQGLLPDSVPEVSLVQGRFLLKPFGSNSKIAELEQTYTIVDVTDRLQVADANLIKFAVLAAFRRNSPETLTWGGRPFCEQFLLSDGSDGASGVVLPGLIGVPDAARGVNRLVSVVAITLGLYFDADTLPR
jgi:hypothetical protein